MKSSRTGSIISKNASEIEDLQSNKSNLSNKNETGLKIYYVLDENDQGEEDK